MPSLPKNDRRFCAYRGIFTDFQRFSRIFAGNRGFFRPREKRAAKFALGQFAYFDSVLARFFLGFSDGILAIRCR
jgi:hypothetical protein